MLLYAYNTIVLAETADELQKALNAVYDYCEMWQLTVNTEKTEVVIFPRAKVKNFPAFVYGHKHIEVVDDYVYLGCTFRYNGNFHKAIAKQVSHAKKAYCSLMKKASNLNSQATYHCNCLTSLFFLYCYMALK